MNVYGTKPNWSLKIFWIVKPVFILRDIQGNVHLLSLGAATIFAREETYSSSINNF